jgi:aldehyde dehydrogenase (NAD+)
MRGVVLPVIDGQRVEGSGDVFETIDPSTEDVLAEVLSSSVEQVDDAVRAAAEAQRRWVAMAPEARSRILWRWGEFIVSNGEELAGLDSLDIGRPIKDARNDPNAGARAARYWAGMAEQIRGEQLPTTPGHLTYTVREPIGVIGVILPWNGPMLSLCNRVSPALACGNGVVVKPSEWSPMSAGRLAELAVEAGMPSGLFNVVLGDGWVGGMLVEHPGVGAVSFTGSPPTGKTIARAAAGKTLTLEQGGKSPVLVFADADLDTAAAMAAMFGTALLTGQGCALPTRTYVHDDVYDVFVEKVLGILGSLVVGDPLDPATFVGPVVTETAMQRILGFIDRARADGSVLLAGGARLGGDLGNGWFVAPTVFGDVDHDSDLARNEVFGPVQAILRFTSEDDVIDQANDSDFGLAAYLHTRDSARVQRVIEGVEAGAVVVNAMGGISPATPFGGYKQSGFGREGGRAGIEEMVRRKTVFVAG